MGDRTTPLRELLNRSGLPFQIAVEAAIRDIGGRHGIDEVRGEVPYSKGFIDVVARKDRIHFMFECKRADDKPWVFVMSDPDQRNRTRCRLEWFNGRAPMPSQPLPQHSRVFCCEWNMVEPSPEAAFCALPKGSPIQSLEALCRDLLAASHDLIADERISRDEFATAVPVVVTTAKLHTCLLSSKSISLDAGEIAAHAGEFTATDLVRFRKSLVTERSNSYDQTPMDLRHWVADRERTVFVMNPSGLERFLAGFRSFHYGDSFYAAPEEFRHPPSLTP